MRFTVYLFAFAAVAFAQDLSIEEEDIEMHLNVPEYKQKVQELTVKAEQLLAMTPEETEEMNSIKAELPDYTPVEAAPGVDENIDTINARSAIKDEFFEGDVILTTQQLESLRMFNNQTSRARRQAQTGPNFPRNQWETLVIPFSFAPGYPSSGIAPIRAAAKFWSDNTCVKFQENAAGNDRVEFIYGNGCYSYIGRVGNKQQVSIGNGCEYKGTVVHELGHTLGLYHTQSRYDRRNYVYVDNTQVGVKDINFVETTAKETDNYGLPYEYTSVMHYGAFDMGRNGKPVMIASRGYEMYQYAMGQRFATFNDVRLVNKYYKCTEKKCPNARLACQNGGYVDPNNCNQCKCPQGWGGQLCNAKPTTGCYKEIQVNGRGSIKVEASNSNKVDFAECTYVFIAPQGRRVGIQVRDLKSTAIRNCFFGGIEIQTRADPTYAGTTFCDQNTPTLSQVLASDTNRLTITARDISYGTSATIDYYAAAFPLVSLMSPFLLLLILLPLSNAACVCSNTNVTINPTQPFVFITNPIDENGIACSASCTYEIASSGPRAGIQVVLLSPPQTEDATIQVLDDGNLAITLDSTSAGVSYASYSTHVTLVFVEATTSSTTFLLQVSGTDHLASPPTRLTTPGTTPSYTAAQRVSDDIIIGMDLTVDDATLAVFQSFIDSLLSKLTVTTDSASAFGTRIAFYALTNTIQITATPPWITPVSTVTRYIDGLSSVPGGTFNIIPSASATISFTESGTHPILVQYGMSDYDKGYYTGAPYTDENAWTIFNMIEGSVDSQVDTFVSTMLTAVPESFSCSQLKYQNAASSQQVAIPAHYSGPTSSLTNDWNYSTNSYCNFQASSLNLTITKSKMCFTVFYNLEAGTDFVHIYANDSSTPYITFTGADVSGSTFELEATAVRIELTTDEKNVFDGFYASINDGTC